MDGPGYSPSFNHTSYLMAIFYDEVERDKGSDAERFIVVL
jgi:hypothetical protein